ncbi:RRQRL motif-containing zinc-binding protein [Saccharopolyspora sp. NPDC049426]|uniref:RRQRL motif-containing zinc-binding protein n=1 Tax=Saccharopolyspora sp. NPDC049426 TaxID=3155652 RepID=UPI003433FE51
MSRRTALQWVELPDGRCELGWIDHGLPTFRFGHAPSGLATRRQLREAGLCPGGQGIVAQITWKRGRRWAGLYRMDLAKPKRRPSLGQQLAVCKALRARRTCPTCPAGQRVKDYYLPTSPRRCFDCLRHAEEIAQLAA